MLAGALGDFGTVLFGVSAVIISISGLVVVLRRQLNRVEAHVKDMTVTLESVDHAVNQVPKGEMTLRQTVEDIALTVGRINVDVVDLHTKVDAAAALAATAADAASTAAERVVLNSDRLDALEAPPAD